MSPCAMTEDAVSALRAQHKDQGQTVLSFVCGGTWQFTSTGFLGETLVWTGGVCGGHSANNFVLNIAIFGEHNEDEP